MSSISREPYSSTYSLLAPSTTVDYTAREDDDLDSRRRNNSFLSNHNDSDHSPYELNHLSTLGSSNVYGNGALLSGLGKPTVKKRLHPMDTCAAALSLVCAILAFAAIASERVSWYLGIGNRQLAVLGFLLSIMNLSLSSISSTFFLLIEARYGRSTIQNYDGIMRNQFLGSSLDLHWRLIIGLMLALPLGLSVAYKQFAGGHSAMEVNSTDYTGNISYYGMFAPPGLQDLGANKGIALFSNATLPFQVAASPIDGVEPPLPSQPQAYGFNILLLNNESSAVLDIPQPSYITAIQRTLSAGESWNITANVTATVATFGRSKMEQQKINASYFNSFCKSAQDSSGAYTSMSMLNHWSVVLIDRPSPGNQSEQYVALTPDPGINYVLSCSNVSHYSRPYEVTRRHCEGTWSIARGSMRLLDGSCDTKILPPEKQLVITDNTLFLGVWYMSSLVELIGPFATTRNNSAWTSPHMATGIAAMLWSRITALDSAASSNYLNGAKKFHDLSYEDAGLLYQVDDQTIYIRPTLRKSYALYFILTIQPILLLVMLCLIVSFHSTPLSQGFGLVSILAGIDNKSLDVLAGSTLSGRLSESVKLNVRPIQKGDKSVIRYFVGSTSTGHGRNGRLTSKVIYH